MGGAGQIDQSELSTVINQQTGRLAIDWNSFDVDSNESVTFIQPDVSSIALNRILGSNASEIHGRLSSNGHVILVNPHGVFFGESASVNVGGLIASGLDISPEEFMNGSLNFAAVEGAEGQVVNSGLIQAATGGSVTLLGKQVQNDGLIVANLGAVNLAAGTEAVVTFDSAGLVGVRVTKEVLQEELGIDAAVLNSGEISAAGGRILMTASTSQDIFSQAVNTGDIQQANSVVVHDDGTFTLGKGADVINSGTLDVSVESGKAGTAIMLGQNVSSSGNVRADSQHGSAGNIEIHGVHKTLVTGEGHVSAQAIEAGTGGDVKLLGRKVGLFDTAEVSTSGAHGGGTVLVGGDESGRNLRVRNSEFIYLGQDTSISADGMLDGDGGRVIAFASDTARIQGELSSSGGVIGGDGGFVETSGLRHLELSSTPRVSSTTGSGGTWLIDPYDLTITSGIDGPGGGSEDGYSDVFVSGLDDTEIGVEKLEDALGNDASVILRTGSGGDPDGGVITFNSGLTYNFDGVSTLRLEAHNGIDLNGRDIRRANDGSGILNLKFLANTDGEGSGDVIFNGGQVRTSGGYFHASGANFSTGDDGITGYGLVDTSHDTGAGDITINGTGNVTLGSFNVKGTDGEVEQLPTISVVSGGDVNWEREFNYDDIGYINSSDPVAEKPTLSIEAAGDINLKESIYDSGSGDIDALDITLTADSDHSGAGSVNITNNIYTAGGDFTATGFAFDSQSGTINTEDANWGNNSARSHGGNVGITSSSTVDLGAVETDSTCDSSFTCTGDFYIRRGYTYWAGEPTQLANIDVKQADDTTLKVAGKAEFDIGSAGTLTLTEENTFAGNVTFVSAGDVSLVDTDTGGLSVGSSDVSGSLSLTGNGITDEGLVTVSGSTSFSTNGDSLAFGDYDHNFSSIADITASQVAIKDTDSVIIGNVYATSSGGSITIDGNVVLEKNVTLDTNAGDIVIKGSLTDTGGDHGLTIDGKAISFGQLGTFDNRLGAVKLNGTGAISALDETVDPAVASDLYLASLEVTNSTSFTAGDIITAGDTNANGGPVNITSSGHVSVDSIDTSGGSAAATDTSGGAVVISAGSIAAGNLDTSSSDFLELLAEERAENGAGGAITLTADNRDIALLGDIDSRYRGGTTQGAVNVNATATGAEVDLGSTFFTSEITVNGSGADSSLVGVSSGAVWTIDDANSGSLSDGAGSSSVYFTGMENLFGGDAQDTFNVVTGGSVSGVVDGNQGDDSFNLGTASGAHTVGFSGDDGFGEETSDWLLRDIHTFTSNGAESTLFLAQGDNTWTISGNESGTISTSGESTLFDGTVSFTGFDTLRGGTGSDSFNIGAMGVIGTIDGGSGSEVDSITGKDVATRWTIGKVDGSDAQTGKVAEADGSLYVSTFTNIESLKGGSLQDTFTYTADADYITLDGGDTDTKNILDLSQRTSVAISIGSGDLSNVSRVQHLHGNSTDSTLGIISGSNQWDVTAQYAGKVTSSAHDDMGFTGFTHLLGGSGQDYFQLADVTNIVKAVDGGGGSDSLAKSAGINSWQITGAQAGSVNGIGFDDMENLIGGSGNDEIAGRNQENNWIITELGNGAVANSADTDRVWFTNFEELEGGASTDVFTFEALGAIAGIDGGAGEDRIFGRDADNRWDINSVNSGSLSEETATELWSPYLSDFSGIENLEGGTANDDFVIGGPNGAVLGSIDGGNSAASNTIVMARPVETDWFITGSRAGSLEYSYASGTSTPTARTTFRNIDVLTGSAAQDRFHVDALEAMTLDGGASTNDVLDLFDLDSAIQIALGSDEPIGGNLTVNNIAEIKASPGYENTLLGYVDGSSWSLTNAHAGTVKSSGTGATVAFSNFQTLQGSATGADTFSFQSSGSIGTIRGGGGEDAISGRDQDTTWNMITATNGSTESYIGSFTGIERITGGSGSDTANFTGNSALDVGIGISVDADISLVHFEQVISDSAVGHRLLGDNRVNTWSISGADTGKLNGSLSFQGFANLVGNRQDDTFILSTDGDITGTIDGRRGINTLDMRNVEKQLEITYNATGGAGGMAIHNISSIDGRNGYDNSLRVEGGNAWTINGADAGVLNADGLQFYGFGTLIGGDQDDRFLFTNAGSLGGYIDGGGDSIGDVVDFSARSSVDIEVGDNAYQNIETVIGNGAAGILRGGDGAFIWSLNNGENNGQVNGTQFVDFGTIVGGDDSNTFNVNGGWLTGAIIGADGAINSLNLTVGSGGTQSLSFQGGGTGASNSVAITGGSDDMSVTHSITDTGEGLFSYDDLEFSFAGVTQINDSAQAQNLTLLGGAGADNTLLTASGYTFAGMDVSSSNKTDITVAGSADDLVTLGGDIAVPGVLTINDARLATADPAYELTATTLQLNNVASAGSSSGRVRVDLDNLALNGAQGAVFLDGAGDLNISRFATDGLVDITLDDDLTSSVDLISSHAVRLESEGGSLNLGRMGNALSGELDLAAAETVTLGNQGATHLGVVSARTLNVTSSGAISGIGPLSVSGDATFSAGGSLSLQHDDNTLNRVAVNKADNVTIANTGGLTLRDVSATGNLSTSSNSLNVIGAVSAANLDARTHNGAANLAGALNIDGGARVNAEGIAVNGAINASTIELNANTGDLQVFATLGTGAGQDVTLAGTNIQQNATITAGRNLNITALGDFTQSANITAADTIEVGAGGAITTASGAQTEARHVTYSAVRDLSLQDITAADGLSLESSAGTIRQNGSIRSSGDIALNAEGVSMASGSRLASSSGSITINSRGTTRLASVSAADAVVVEAGGALTAEKDVSATAGAITLTSSANLVTQGTVQGENGVNITSTDGDVSQSANYLAASGSVTVTAGRNLTMADTAETTVDAGSITYAAGENLTLGHLAAKGNTIALKAEAGTVTQTASGTLSAERLEIDAGAGIGTEAPLTMTVSQLAVSNQRGSANIHNTGELTIDRFRNNGDITITNSGGNLILNTAIGEPYKMGESDANVAGGTSNANYDQGSVTIRLTDGDILATGPARADTPDIVARDATIIAPIGDIGTVSRPLVLYVKDGVFIQGFRSWPPIWGFNTEPKNGMTNASSIQINLLDLLNAGSEQLVEVESLEDIDPAVFADIQNFFYDDVSILLPEDQRWEE